MKARMRGVASMPRTGVLVALAKASFRHCPGPLAFPPWLDETGGRRGRLGAQGGAVAWRRFLSSQFANTT